MPRITDKEFEARLEGVPLYISRTDLTFLIDEARRARSSEKLAYKVMLSGCSPRAVFRFIQHYEETTPAPPRDASPSQR